MPGCTASYFSFGLCLFYCLILMIGLVAWLRNRDQKVLLWLSLWACAFLLSVLLNGLRLPWPFGVSTGIAQSVLALADVAMWYLLLNLLELNRHPFSPDGPALWPALRLRAGYSMAWSSLQTGEALTSRLCRSQTA
jgi:hypothetical protein